MAERTEAQRASSIYLTFETQDPTGEFNLAQGTYVLQSLQIIYDTGLWVFDTPSQFSTLIDVKTPKIRLHSGSLVVELFSSVLHNGWVYASLAFVGFVIKRGPQIARWPGEVRRAWFESNAAADVAKIERRRRVLQAEYGLLNTIDGYRARGVSVTDVSGALVDASHGTDRSDSRPGAGIQAGRHRFEVLRGLESGKELWSPIDSRLIDGQPQEQEFAHDEDGDPRDRGNY
ncbi:hypothetical protein [Dactylosporangium salmoneum]|uniref:Uncharacterized protein n=1 Tax=Dactylosporangium salmoneum TaxID=53361 RepID=A0ABP5TX69_9ACTN